MAIYSIDQIRQQLPEFKDADEVTLLQQYSRSVGMPFEQVADYFGVKPRGTAAEAGRQFVGGLVSGVPRMAGMAAQAFSQPGEPIYELGTRAREFGEQQGLRYEPDLRGRGLLGEAVVKGARGVAEAAPALGAAFIPGVGLYAAPAAAAALFGGSAYQEAYERVLRDTGDEEAARAAAIRTAGIQGGGEALATTATMGLGRALRPLLPGARTTTEVAEQMTRPGVAAPFARAYGTNLAVQPTTEVLQDIGSEYVAREYGAKPEDIGGIARESALGGFGMALLLGPLQFGNSVQRSRRADALREALAPDSQLPLETKMQAYNLIQAEAQRAGVPAADVSAWANDQLLREGERIDKQIRLEEAAQMLQDWQNAVSRGDIASALAAEQGVRGAAWVPEEQQKKIEEDFLAAYNAPSGITVREADPNGAPVDRELTMGELLSRRQEQAAQGLDLTSMTGPNTSTSQQAASLLRGLTTNLAPGTQQVQTAGFVSPNIRQLESGVYLTEPLAGEQQQQPAGRAARRTPAPGVQEVAPGIFTAPEGPFVPRRIETGANVPPLSLVSPVGAVSGVSPSAGSPAASAAGVSSTAPAAPVTPVTPTTPAQPKTQRGQQAAAAGTAPTKTAQEPLSDDVASEIDKILEARVASERAGKVQGEISLPQGVFKGLVRMLRSPSEQAPIVYADKGAAEDPERTVQFAGKMREIYDAAQRVLFAARDLASSEANVFKASRGETTPIKATTPEETIAKADVQASAKYQKIVAQRQVLNNALQALRAAAGNDANAEALIAVLKARTQKRETKPINVKRFSEIASLLGKKPGTVSQAEYDTILDSLISRSWNDFKQGTLDRAESADVIRGIPIRRSREATKAGEAETLVEAVEQGLPSYSYKAPQRKANESGAEFAARVADAEARYAARVAEAKGTVVGLLNWFRGLRGTAYENMLAKATLEAIRNTAAKALPKIQWIAPDDTQTKPSYDPKTDTITIHREASAEETLHETLHAALQWFVHSNPALPEVKALSRALDTVLATDISKTNLTDAQKAKAQEVVDVIRAVRTRAKDKKTAEVDAVLEFISYGNTLREFRELLKAIPKRPDPETTKWRRAVSDLYNRLIALMQRFLGVKDTMANEVLENTMSLLQKVATTEQKAPEKLTGQTLQAEIQSDIDTAKSISKTLKEADVSVANFKVYAGKQAPSMLSSQFAFEALGFGEGRKLTMKIDKARLDLAQKIRTEYPQLERMILQLDNTFGQPGLRKFRDRFRSEANTSFLDTEATTMYIRANPQFFEPVIDYLDGDAKALDKVNDNGKLKSMADNIKFWHEKYIEALPANSRERTLFKSLKYSEYLMYPTTLKEVAGTTFGLDKLGKLTKTETEKLEDIDSFKEWLKTDADGSVDQDDKMYRVMERTLDGKLRTAGFMSIDRYNAEGTPTKNAPQGGFIVEPDRIWQFDKFQDKNYTFRGNMPAKAAVKKIGMDKVMHAMLNTTAGLAHHFAGRNWLNSMAAYGRAADGKATPQTVAFKTIDEVNETFAAPERKEGETDAEFAERAAKSRERGATFKPITEDQVLVASDAMAKSAKAKFSTQRTGTWVKLPQSTNYGPIAGMYVPGPVWNMMVEMHDRSLKIDIPAVQAAMAVFKSSKTALNPGTHITNIGSNLVLMYLHGVPMKTLLDASRLMYNFEFRPKSLSAEDMTKLQLFRRSGAMLGNFASTEIKQEIYKAFDRAIDPAKSDASVTSKLLGLAKYEKAKAALTKYAGKANELYAAEDNVFRLAAFLHTAGNIQQVTGKQQLTEEELYDAGLQSRKNFLDYDIDSPMIRTLRQSVLPFVSFSYAIMPVLGRLAVTKPWAMTNVLLGLMILNFMTSGGDDEEARKAGPEYIRDRLIPQMNAGPYMHVRVPFLGDDKNPVYMNLGKYIPFTSLLQPPPGKGQLFGQEWIPGFVTPSGPFVSFYSVLVGTDTFTGKSIHQPTDTEWQKILNTSRGVYDIFAPGAVNSQFWKSASDLWEGKKGITGVEPDALFLARKLGGLGVYQYNIDEARAKQSQAVQAIKRDYDMAISRLKRDEMRKGYPDFEALSEDLADLRARMMKEMAKARGED